MFPRRISGLHKLLSLQDVDQFQRNHLIKCLCYYSGSHETNLQWSTQQSAGERKKATRKKTTRRNSTQNHLKVKKTTQRKSRKVKKPSVAFFTLGNFRWVVFFTLANFCWVAFFTLDHFLLLSTMFFLSCSFMFHVRYVIERVLFQGFWHISYLSRKIS